MFWRLPWKLIALVALVAVALSAGCSDVDPYF